MAKSVYRAMLEQVRAYNDYPSVRSTCTIHFPSFCTFLEIPIDTLTASFQYNPVTGRITGNDKKSVVRMKRYKTVVRPVVRVNGLNIAAEKVAWALYYKVHAKRVKIVDLAKGLQIDNLIGENLC